MEMKLTDAIKQWPWFRHELNLGDRMKGIDADTRQKLVSNDTITTKELFRLAEEKFKNGIKAEYEGNSLHYCCSALQRCEEKFACFEEKYQHISNSARVRHCTTRKCREPAFTFDSYYPCEIIFGDCDDALYAYVCEAGHVSFNRFCIATFVVTSEKEFMDMRKAELVVVEARKARGLKEDEDNEEIDKLIDKAKSDINW